MSDKYIVAVVGATGAVGREMIRVLEERKFPVKTLVPLATKKKNRRTVRFKGKDITVKVTEDASFNGVDVTLFAGGDNASKEFAWEAVRRGSIVIDNSSTFRMRPDVPLIIPEVNIKHIQRHQGLIANPNCSTIQMCMAVKPLYEKLGVTRIVVSTYQAVSGKGKAAGEELKKQTKALANNRKYAPKVFPQQISFNCLPHIDIFNAAGNTLEEVKIVEETRKIFSNPQLPISATCVRVPVMNGHAQSINIQTRKRSSVDNVRKILSRSPGVTVVDEPDPVDGDEKRRTYPTPLYASGKDEVYIGRVRKDLSVEYGFNMWCVADNLRKGAALNAVQIAEFIF